MQLADDRWSGKPMHAINIRIRFTDAAGRRRVGQRVEEYVASSSLSFSSSRFATGMRSS